MAEEAKIKTGSADWYLDPVQVNTQLGLMNQLAQETVRQNPDLPELANKVQELLYEKSTALKLTAQQATEERIKDQFEEELRKTVQFYGVQGEFGRVYEDMVRVSSNYFDTLDPNYIRDTVRTKFGDYFSLHFNASAQNPSQQKIDILTKAIDNPDMQGLVPLDTMKQARVINAQMIDALQKTSEDSYASRLKNLNEYQRTHPEAVFTDNQKSRYLFTGNFDAIDPSKQTELEKRQAILEAVRNIMPLPKEWEAMYLAEGKFPEDANKDMVARRAQIDLINKGRVADGVPELPQHKADIFVLTGTWPKDTTMEEKLKMNAEFIKRDPTWAGSNREKKFLGATLSPTEKGQEIVEELAGALNYGQGEFEDPVVPTQEEIKRKLNIDKKGSLVNVNVGEDAYEKETGTSIAKRQADRIALRERAFNDKDTLARIKNALQEKDPDTKKSLFIPGGFASTRQFVGKIADYFQSFTPIGSVGHNALNKILAITGDPSAAEQIDQAGKELLLQLAKHVGRITNLSLNFSRDAVPGLLKTKEGNELIIAILDRVADINIGLGDISDRYRNVYRTPWPTSEDGSRMMSYDTAIANYRKENPVMTPEFVEKLAQIRGKGRKPLIEVAKPPTGKNRDFKKYLKTHKDVIDALGIDSSSLTYDGLLPEVDENGTKLDSKAYYFRDQNGKYLIVPLDWKNEITLTGKGNWNPVTEGPTPIPDNPFDKKLSEVTLDDILSLDKNTISNFYSQNKGNLIAMGLDESLLQEIENIYTQEIESELP